MPEVVIQYVGFRTDLSATAFRVLWTPVAFAFKLRGIAAIDLYEFAPGGPVAFLSRNVWQPGDYLRAFPSGLADAAAFGPVAVVQYGGYGPAGTAADAPAAGTLFLSLSQSEPAARGPSSVVRGRVTQAVPYRFAAEGPGGPSDPDAVRFSGTHVCRL